MKPLLKASTYAYSIGAAFLLTLTLAITGCSNPGAQEPLGSEQSTEDTTPTPTSLSAPVATVSTSAPCSVITVPTAAPAIQTAVIAGTPQSQTAPSYWEIRHTVLCITAKQPTPPPVEKDYYPPDELLDYMLYLRGMRFEGWQGWIENVKPVKFRANDYGISVYMEIPEEVGTGDSARIVSTKRVGLADITEEQVTKLKLQMDARQDVRWHKVVFGGLIDGLMEDGQVFAYKNTIAIIEE